MFSGAHAHDATPTPAPDEFRDDFGTISGRWLVTQTVDYAMGYVDGTYRIQVSPSKRRAGSLVGLDRPGDRVLEVDGRAMNDVSQAYGLIVSSDEYGGLLAALSCRQRAITLWYAGKGARRQRL